MTQECKIDGCTRLASTKGMCSAHYSRSLHGIPLDKPLKLNYGAFTKCSVTNCDRKAGAKGLCPSHYQRKWLGISLEGEFRTRGDSSPICSVDGCGRKRHSRGYCQAHYSRNARGMDMSIPIRGGNPGVFVSKGYKMIYSREEKKCVPEHRYIASKLIGRPLHSYEVVHHIDEDSFNNDPSNLEILTRYEHRIKHSTRSICVCPLCPEPKIKICTKHKNEMNSSNTVLGVPTAQKIIREINERG